MKKHLPLLFLLLLPFLASAQTSVTVAIKQVNQKGGYTNQLTTDANGTVLFISIDPYYGSFIQYGQVVCYGAVQLPTLTGAVALDCTTGGVTFQVRESYYTTVQGVGRQRGTYYHITGTITTIRN